MPTVYKYPGQTVSVRATIKNIGVDISNFAVRLRLASPYIVYQLTFPPIGSFKSGTTIDWTGTFTIGTDWLTGDYTLVFVGMDGDTEFQEIITDWTITIISPW
jgi:hypothetical protein